MKEHILTPESFVWLVLVSATLISWMMGSGDWASEYVTTGALLIAFIKARLLLQYFMEVRKAQCALKFLADAWVVVVCSTLLVLYFELV